MVQGARHSAQRRACRHREAFGSGGGWDRAKILRDGEGDNSELRGFPEGPAGTVTATMTAADLVRFRGGV
jgi:hypothetical protein